MENFERFLSFEINNRKFAFEAKNVMEVLLNRPINPIPQAAEYVVGVINFRGDVVTVIDTSLKFGIKDYSIKEKRIVIVVCMQFDNKQLKLACLCDNVLRMETLNYSEIQKVPNFGTYYNPALLKGVFYINNDLYSIIDIEKVFSTEELLVLSNIS